MAFTPRRFEQIFADMIARLVARTALSDVGDASGVKQVLAASSREDDEIYFQMSNILAMFDISTATGDDLDERAAEIQPGTISRLLARVANGALVFTRTGVAGTDNISAGTRCQTVDGAVFVTTAVGSILPTFTDSSPIPCVAEVPGSAGNVASNTVTKMINKPINVVSVTNPLPMLNGLDKESDDSFRQRIKYYVASLSRGTVLALEQGVLGLEDATTGQSIRYSKAFRDFTNPGTVTVYLDDGSGAIETTAAIVGENVCFGLLGPPPNSAVGGETELYLDNVPVKAAAAYSLTSSIRGALTAGVEYTLDPTAGQIVFNPALAATEVITASYTYYTGLIQEAQKVIDGDPADRVNYPGIRAAGDLVYVQPPQVLIQTVTAVVAPSPGYSQSEAVSESISAVAEYINSLGISDDVIRNEVISRIQSLPEVADLTLIAPAANNPILDDQLARITLANISIT